MYTQLTDQFTKQMQDSFKPMTELLEINVKTIEALAQKQAEFFTTAVSQSKEFTQSLTGQKDLQAVFQAQKEYSEEFQSKLVEASKDAFSVLTEAQDKATAIVNGAFASVEEATPEVSSTAKTAK